MTSRALKIIIRLGALFVELDIEGKCVWWGLQYSSLCLFPRKSEGEEKMVISSETIFMDRDVDMIALLCLPVKRRWSMYFSV